MIHHRKGALVCALLLVAGSALSAQQNVPVRELTPVEARTRTSFGNIFGVRPLADGGVLVNDGVRRQLVALDASFSRRRIVIDSVAEGGNSYGPRAAPLIPYLADSSLFVDGTSLSLLVLDPMGKFAHVMAAPKPADMRFLAGSSSGIDEKGNLIYEGITVVSRRGSRPEPGAAPLPPIQIPDSSPVVRANFDTRTVDTIGKVKTQGGGSVSIVRLPDGRSSSKRTINPVTTIDEWAVLSDGSVAFVRGQDYHIDWIRPDGSRFSSPKLPFDWKRLTDEDKQKLVDSARTEIERDRAMPVTGTTGTAVSGTASGGPERIRVSGGGSGAGLSVGGMSAEPPPPERMAAATIEFVPLKEISDYYPPIRNNAAQADLDGNLWILPTTSAQSKAGELVYDVVNNKGDLTQRVRMPAGRSIAGFGRGGVVYLMSRDNGAWFLERAKVAGK